MQNVKMMRRRFSFTRREIDVGKSFVTKKSLGFVLIRTNHVAHTEFEGTLDLRGYEGKLGIHKAEGKLFNSGISFFSVFVKVQEQ